MNPPNLRFTIFFGWVGSTQRNQGDFSPEDLGEFLRRIKFSGGQCLDKGWSKPAGKVADKNCQGGGGEDGNFHHIILSTSQYVCWFFGERLGRLISFIYRAVLRKIRWPFWTMVKFSVTWTSKVVWKRSRIWITCYFCVWVFFWKKLPVEGWRGGDFFFHVQIWRADGWNRLSHTLGFVPEPSAGRNRTSSKHGRCGNLQPHPEV